MQASSYNFRDVCKVRTKAARESLTEQPIGVIEATDFSSVVDPRLIEQRFDLLVKLRPFDVSSTAEG
jgi:hypothetical protein